MGQEGSLVAPSPGSWLKLVDPDPDIQQNSKSGSN